MLAFSRSWSRALVLLGPILCAYPARATSLHVQYGVSLVGLPIGVANLTGTFSASGYKIDGNAKVTGLASIIASSRGAATASGNFSGGHVQPSAYSTTAANTTESRSVRMAMAGGTVRLIDIAPPFEERADRIPISDTDKKDITAYSYAQGLLMSETLSQVSGVTTTTYEYTDDLVRTVTTGHDGAQTVYEYTLDDRGYVQLAALLNPVASVSLPTHYSYEYTNCRLHFRIAYDMNDAPNLDATAEYFYDDEGNMIRRTSIIADEQFDYSSCW